MIKSTASAGPVELQNSPSAYYLWEFPEKPVSVRLSLDMVDRLERDVLESFRAITARGSEVGGLLLGRSDSGSTANTIIENYELFHCDYTRGPLFLILFSALMAGAGNGISIVAFPWLVLQRNGSALDASIVAMAGTLPLLAATLIAGAAVDYLGRRRVSMISDALSALSVAAVPVLALTFGVHVINVAVLAVLVLPFVLGAAWFAWEVYEPGGDGAVVNVTV